MSQINTELSPVKKPTRLNLDAARKKDREMVKGIFKFYEVPGGSLSFSFHKYKEDPLENFTLVDGQVYTIPRGVAKHLTTNCWYPEYEYVKGEDVRSNTSMKTKVHRFAFQSLEFMDEEMIADARPSIVEAIRT